MKLYLVRHGQTDWNAEGKMQGRRGAGLNELGVKQVEDLKVRLNDFNFSICFSSPLKRAVETAEILVGDRCEILYDERLVERGFGIFEGRSFEEFWDSVGDNDIEDRRLNYSKDGLEPINSILERARSFLEDVKENYEKNDNILVVAHGAFLRALHFEIVGYDDDTDFHGFHFENAEMREYEV